MRFLQPAIETPGSVRNLSETGALVACPSTLEAGTYVELELTPYAGPTLKLSAQVSRGGGGERLAAVRFLQLSDEVSEVLAAFMQRLLQTDEARVTGTIVVADDDPSILEFLADSLAKYGYQVVKARRGEEALDTIRQLKPKLVLLDILMPGMDGVDVCKMMRADVELVDTPVVFLSALTPDRLHQVADEAGATDYLEKPVSLGDLINLIGLYLR